MTLDDLIKLLNAECFMIIYAEVPVFGGLYNATMNRTYERVVVLFGTAFDLRQNDYSDAIVRKIVVNDNRRLEVII